MKQEVKAIQLSCDCCGEVFSNDDVIETIIKELTK